MWVLVLFPGIDRPMLNQTIAIRYFDEANYQACYDAVIALDKGIAPGGLYGKHYFGCTWEEVRVQK